MEPKKKAPPKKAQEPEKIGSINLLEEWEKAGIPCYYVRFQSPVPPAQDKEPVFEFALSAKNNKYLVDKITLSEHGIIWRCGNELDITPTANYQYARSIVVRLS